MGARGHLFQGRFKSMLVENDAYLLQLSCYIHRNPLRAGLVQRLADYPWSSYRVYAYGQKPADWLETGLILKQFKVPHPHKAYREKVQGYAREEKRLWAVSRLPQKSNAAMCAARQRCLTKRGRSLDSRSTSPTSKVASGQRA